MKIKLYYLSLCVTLFHYIRKYRTIIEANTQILMFLLHCKLQPVPRASYQNYHRGIIGEIMFHFTVLIR